MVLVNIVVSSFTWLGFHTNSLRQAHGWAGLTSVIPSSTPTSRANNLMEVTCMVNRPRSQSPDTFTANPARRRASCCELLQAGQIHQIHRRHAGVSQCHDEHPGTTTEGRDEHAKHEGRLFRDGDDQRWDAVLSV